MYDNTLSMFRHESRPGMNQEIADRLTETALGEGTRGAYDESPCLFQMMQL